MLTEEMKKQIEAEKEAGRKVIAEHAARIAKVAEDVAKTAKKLDEVLTSKGNPEMESVARDEKFVENFNQTKNVRVSTRVPLRGKGT